MIDFNQWDFAGVFTAVQTALLIEGKDPDAAGIDGRNGRFDDMVSDVILSRMRGDYVKTHSNYSFQDIAYDGPHLIRELLPWESVLPSYAMHFHASRCFEYGLQAEFNEWLGSDGSDFNKQQFDRKNIQSWLDINRLPSKYQFEKMVSPIEPSHEEGAARMGARWPAHETKILTALRLATVKFWTNYDPRDPNTAPLNEDVVEWLVKEHDLSLTLAGSMATILRSDDLKKGPRPK